MPLPGAATMLFHVGFGFIGGLWSSDNVQQTEAANAVNSRKPLRSSTWNECCTNERESRDSNRSSTNAGVCEEQVLCLVEDITANERSRFESQR